MGAPSPKLEVDMTIIGEKPRILVIDDDEAILELMKVVLSRKFNVSILSKPESAVDQIGDYQPHLIILDNHMPVLSGLELCRTIRSDQNWSWMPIVFLSAFSGTDEQNLAYEAGADDYLEKPIEVDRLEIKIKLWARMAMRSQRLVEQNRRLSEIAKIDPLTGLYNRRAAIDFLEEEVERMERYGTPFSVMLADVDDFKRINDEYGHQAGDEALKTVGDALRKSVRANDRVTRFGGDEFLVILAGSGREATESVCKKINSAKIKCCLRDGAEEVLTLSLGASTAEKGIKPDALVDSADLAMLVSKQNGKGRWHIHANNNDDDELAILKELQTTRDSVRQALCRLLGSTLSQLEREGDVAGSRYDLLAHLGERLADRLELSKSDRLTLRNSLMLTTFERVNLPAELNDRNKSELTAEKLQALRSKMLDNIQRLRSTGFLLEESNVLWSMHERADGSGFPDGLKGNEIPFISRLVGLLSCYVNQYSDESNFATHYKHAIGNLRGRHANHFEPELLDHLEAAAEEYFTQQNYASGDLLLIEDYEPTSAIMKKRLAAHSYRVTVAGSAKAARELFPTKNWRAVLMDIMLPDENGTELAREFLQSDLRQTPIIIISASSDQDSIIKAKDAGCAGYFAKPVRIEDLVILLANCEKEKPEFRLVANP